MKGLLLISLLFCGPSRAGETPFKVPDGFQISHFAGDALAHDIWCMTLDSEDRVCVGGPGYIKFLVDTDNDGKADQVILFTDKVRTGPMGLLVDGTRVISVESNAVVQYHDEDGDLKADGEPEILVEFTGKGGEHGPHGIRKGPDGWYYVVCGNNTGVNGSHANLPGSPVKYPGQGCILRIAPDWSGSEVVADGFRNPYDIAFSDEGRLFTYDSDNERDHHLPWYAQTRLFDVAFGRHHGWLNPGYIQSYNTPDYYTVDCLAQTGRGSPTGVEYYWHDAFPEIYRKGLFYACWTFGRIYFSALEWESQDGLMQERRFKKTEPQIFAEAGPEGGFAPVDLAVDSTGNLWVACGGRNTSGNVYRISAPGGPGVKKERKLSMPQFMVGRNLLKAPLQHPQTVRTFLKNQEDLYLVYQAFQNSHGGINHLPEPRSIDAGYCLSFLPTTESQALRDAITAESGGGLLLDMDLQSEDALTKDAEEFAEFWEKKDTFTRIEPWRDRNFKELARTLGCVKTEFAPVLEHLTAALREDTPPTDDVHYLFCLAQIPAPRTSIATWRIAAAFLRVDWAELVKDNLPDLPVEELREAWDNQVSVRPILASWLIKNAEPGQDSSRLFEALVLPDSETARQSAEKLFSRDSVLSATETELVLSSLVRHQKYVETRKALQALLGAESFLDAVSKAKARFPESSEITRLAGSQDMEALKTRLTKVNWDSGNAVAGKEVFTRLSCAVCHSGQNRLGPDLKGVTARFGRDDFFIHTVNPNLAISDLYQAMEVTTVDRRHYIGVPVYTSPDQTLLEVGPGQTVNFSQDDILTSGPVHVSPMPEGLLLGVGDQELAHLWTYIKTL